MDRGLCIFCHLAPITGRKRKYCDAHSHLASTLWKRKHRRVWKAAGDKYWASDWKHKTPEERKTYFRNYMREYRKKAFAVPSRVTHDVAGTVELAARWQETLNGRTTQLSRYRGDSEAGRSIKINELIGQISEFKGENA